MPGRPQGFTRFHGELDPDFLPTGILNIGLLLPLGIMLLSDFEREYPDVDELERLFLFE
jgi:hypothetical protein